jgi:erythronate-4-phosphate dehydrogenase
MRILCDGNLALTPALRGAASSLTTKPGREIVHTDLINVDALLVRSVTVVDASLLRNTAVKFVGTATAGIDHINCHDLENLGIAFASAPGANANAVAEWVLGALAYSGGLRALLEGGVLGIVGFGHVGKRLNELANRLGIRTLIYDPWIVLDERVSATNDLGQILNCTAVSLHAALHDQRPWPSRDLLFETALPNDANRRWMVNAGRGALLSLQTCNRLKQAGWHLCLDTWPEEPVISQTLLSSVNTATPHIAGYTQAAKTKATDSLVTSMLTAVGAHSHQLAARHSAPPNNACVNHAPTYHGDSCAWLEQLLISSCCIERDDATLRQLDANGVSSQAFDALRHNYVVRGELAGSNVVLPAPTPQLIAWCQALEIEWRNSASDN